MMQKISTYKKLLALLAAGAILCAITWYAFTHSYGISPYKSYDQQALTEILKKDWYWLVSEDSTDFSTEYMFAHKAALPSLPDGSLNIFVYRVHGKPVGFVTYYREAGCRGRVQFLAVAQDYRRCGYAKKLLNYAIEDFAEHGVCIIELATRTNNSSAQRLYRQLRFRQTWNESGFVGFERSLLA